MIESKILIIDDEVEFASTLCQRLCLRDIETAEAHSGADGLVKIEEFKPDIIILDLKMPDMNGLDMLVEIKGRDRKVEVIMLTGHGSTASGIEAMEKGAFDYIMKPVDLGELLNKIQQADHKRRETGYDN